MRGGYDLMGGLQFALLLALGLRENHKLCDVGCGSLRAGRLFIPYLEPDNYFGVEPEQWKIEAGLSNEVGAEMVASRRPTFDYFADFGLERFGVEFDYVLAQSVFSHTYLDLTMEGLRAIRSTLSPDGVFVGTFWETAPLILPRGSSHRPTEGSGFRHSLCVAYTWREWNAAVRDAGLVGRRFRWRHKRQTWVVATRADHEARLREVVGGAMDRLRGRGRLGDAKRRAMHRLTRSGS
jgi:hypothetical protein